MAREETAKSHGLLLQQQVWRIEGLRLFHHALLLRQDIHLGRSEKRGTASRQITLSASTACRTEVTPVSEEGS